MVGMDENPYPAEAPSFAMSETGIFTVDSEWTTGRDVSIVRVPAP